MSNVACTHLVCKSADKLVVVLEDIMFDAE